MSLGAIDDRCAYCGTTLNLHSHHIVYRSQGGADTHDNLITLCWFHHSVVHNDPKWMLKLLFSLRNMSYFRWHTAMQKLESVHAS